MSFKNLVLSFFTSVIFSCSTLTLKDPQVEVTRVDVANVSAKDMTLNLKLKVDNPNSIPLNLDKVTYALKFAGNAVTEGTVDQKVIVPANGVGEVVIPLKFQYQMLDSLLGALLNKSATKNYELNGSAQLGILSIPFSKKGEVNLQQK
jgi:LEA14-like dessication related protein